MTYVSQEGDFPTEPHWAIVRFESVHIPGDERSRTNPGHGYPARTESVIKYQSFTDEQDWLDEIQKIEDSNRKYGNTRYRALKVTPAQIDTSVRVVVN